MKWFSQKSKHKRLNDTQEWERQRALYLSKSEDLNSEFAHFGGRKPYKRIPVTLNERGSFGA